MTDTPNPPETNPTESEKTPDAPAKAGSKAYGWLNKFLFWLLDIVVLAPKLTWRLLMVVGDLTATTDAVGTVRRIKEGIEIKGYNIWLLMASSLLASIGLDTDSAAVIIGAMLISPLMSPILGIGLSVGILDQKTLFDSFRNFGIAIAVSLITSTIYFLITPLGDLTGELAARTKPTILDIGVGFFGGVAGIVAGSRKDMTNAIPGVAIATALMPPLCTAGWGLAHFSLSVFAGAFYLFFLNSVFISLSTFVIVRFLKFPVVEKFQKDFLKQVFSFVSIVVILISIPSIYLFWEVVSESNFKGRVQEFLDQEFPKTEHAMVIDWDYVEEEDNKTLKVVLAGERVSEETRKKREAKLVDHKIKNTKLELIQTDFDMKHFNDVSSEVLQVEKILTLIQERQLELENQIDSLSTEISSKKSQELVPMALANEIRGAFPEMTYFAVTKSLLDSTGGSDSIPDLIVLWDEDVNSITASNLEDRLVGLLKARLEVDTFRLAHFSEVTGEGKNFLKLFGQ